MTAWAYLTHNVTGLHTYVPDEPDVLADYALRGWEPDTPPTATYYIPDPDGLGPVMGLDPTLYAPEIVSENPDEVSPDGTEE